MSANILITLLLCAALAAVLVKRRRAGGGAKTELGSEQVAKPRRERGRSPNRRSAKIEAEPRQRRNRPRLAVTVSDVGRDDDREQDDVEAEWDETAETPEYVATDDAAEPVVATAEAAGDVAQFDGVPEVPLEIAFAAGPISAPGWPEPGELSYQLSVEDFDPEPDGTEAYELGRAVGTVTAETEGDAGYGGDEDELDAFDPEVEAAVWVDEAGSDFDPATGWTDEEEDLPSWDTPDAPPAEWDGSDDATPAAAGATYVNGKRDDGSAVVPPPAAEAAPEVADEGTWDASDWDTASGVDDDEPADDELVEDVADDAEEFAEGTVWTAPDPDGPATTDGFEDSAPEAAHDAWSEPDPAEAVEDDELVFAEIAEAPVDGIPVDAIKPFEDVTASALSEDVEPEPIIVEIAGGDEKSLKLVVEPGTETTAPNAWLLSGDGSVITDGNAVRIVLARDRVATLEPSAAAPGETAAPPASRSDKKTRKLARRLAEAERELAEVKKRTKGRKGDLHKASKAKIAKQVRKALGDAALAEHFDIRVGDGTLAFARRTSAPVITITDGQPIAHAKDGTTTGGEILAALEAPLRASLLSSLLAEYAQDEANRRVADVLGNHGAVSVNRDFDGLVRQLTEVTRRPLLGIESAPADDPA